MFYTFSQNNSGGSFDHYEADGIGYHVVVEADSAQDANDRAEVIGLYFNGCVQGLDCSCCGDRWSDQWWDEAGTETPEAYGGPVKAGWGIPSYIHYKNGTIEKITDGIDKW